ncbi:MAG: ribosome recycling factor [Candidatus Taylorbacteria bacterium RIFCSPLOWO2_12_FULL_48_11]|uniref:Ribosome recycling factor n=1 Tax=Candidatus Taylorbacteria bacterium RIFCSPLOWO2_01_FULL_48_100 TaxID=1802322 RepID=A0A1G2NE80_9BACT|nr:MAG: ribosome recycling factor [Candidatus Taylorbacteria bacterium RIFCSPHIGHO2_01_FULL_48_38]OHA34374.1 MAG: ribosome recycling factor [Candidatus Taylorbacteria bacterium RIFCSPLOWO2_01_FULL_48_100]OHA40199.1 MAG: ribosome recycling factor [Candidatus Taylorbacteria bacterium RIFCSPLOWO2_02_FULL_48_16]OHA45466.1 MAG: ribosome recycling factor [Candidatus Taylorbacteria bacterium RIFCSPLOWO2_12_FULL_48_11]
MAYDFSVFKNKARQVEEWLAKELSALRAGRASPAILDSVLVEAWGSNMPLKQVATITVEDARTLRVAPYDAEQSKAIEKAITAANLGLSAVSGDGGVRVIFPELSSERRAALLKTAKGKSEEARVSFRRVRDEIVRDIDVREKAGSIGEDEKFRMKKELEKLADAEGKKIDDALIRKEKEINS